MYDGYAIGLGNHPIPPALLLSALPGTIERHARRPELALPSLFPAA